MTKPSETLTFFSREIEQNTDALFGVALRMTGNVPDADDLVAESVGKAWAAFETLGDRSRFRPWVFRILRNCFISEQRKKSVRPTESPFLEHGADEGECEISALIMNEPDSFLNWWANPESELSNKNLGEEITAAIDSLPDVFRATIILVNVQGLTYDEAAEALGVPNGTVRSRMKRGRTMLQKALWLQAKEAGLTATRSKGQ